MPTDLDPERTLASKPSHGRDLLVLGVLALFAGAGVGLVGACFRSALVQVNQVRAGLVAWATGANVGGVLLVVAACAAATAFAAWMVRRYAPQASGSGIPHAESVLRGEAPPAPFTLVVVKFFGGVLAMGAGLALGREGPSVQMGATIAHLTGRYLRRNPQECLVLLAAGAGAGLATAFNAPIAGAIFVLEELARRFDSHITIATLATSAGAIAVSRAFLGDQPDFTVAPLPYHGVGAIPLHIALGVCAGLLGVAYNRTILAALAATERLQRCSVELRAGLIGALVGLIAWLAPDLVGGGDELTQRTLEGTVPFLWVALVLPLRFALGPVCYAARTPGGLFAPLLVLGAQLGLLFGFACQWWVPSLAPDARSLAVVGMAAFFTAVVRAPVTGIILVVEMTGCFTLLLPLLSACFSAMLVPDLLGDAPIYDALRGSTLQKATPSTEAVAPHER